MYLLLYISFISLLSFTSFTLATPPTPTKCNADNCARAVSGTRGGSEHLKTASADCSSALIITDFPFATTVTSWITLAEETSTVFVTAANINANGSGKRQIDFRPIPPYATPCVDYYAYSSACSCLGITATVVTDTAAETTETIYWWDFITTTTTITVSASTTSSSSRLSSTSTSSSTSSSSFSSANSSSSSSTQTSMSSSTTKTTPPTPSCTANTLSDPLNCGSCGVVCSSGVCEQGTCTSTECHAQSCGDITNCSLNATCFCFTSSTSSISNAGFCGSNGVCSELTPCSTDADCGVRFSSGNICAVRTCCAESSDELPGVCLQGACGNPSRRLVVLSREWAARRVARGRTAAY